MPLRAAMPRRLADVVKPNGLKPRRRDVKWQRERWPAARHRRPEFVPEAT